MEISAEEARSIPLFDNPKIRRAMECGERISMQLHWRPDKKPYWSGVAATIRATLGCPPDGWTDAEFLADPTTEPASEINEMQFLVESGYYERKEDIDVGDMVILTWYATEKGRELIEIYRLAGFAPERDPHAHTTKEPAQ